MSNGKCTPGPWAIDSDLQPNTRSIIARTSGGVPISANPAGPHNLRDDKANARLIAAAPTMAAYIEYVEAKIEIDEMPFSFEQWAAIAEAELNAESQPQKVYDPVSEQWIEVEE